MVQPVIRRKPLPTECQHDLVVAWIDDRRRCVYCGKVFDARANPSSPSTENGQ
jgi:hypothetical protein